MISIIIPTLNEEKILEKTLKSLKNLHSINYEIIVSDGLSTDNTVKIARQYADRVIMHNGKNRQTIAEGRNLGAAAASGEFLVFIDADVYIPNINEFFSIALNTFVQNRKLVALTVFLKVLPEHVTLSDRLFFGIVNRLYQFLNNAMHIGAASGEFQMIRAQAFARVNGFNPNLVVGEDNDIFSRLSKIGETKVATGLHVMHTSRRAREIGWTSLLGLWIGNFLFHKTLKKQFSKEWKPVR